MFDSPRSDVNNAMNDYTKHKMHLRQLKAITKPRKSE